MPIVPEVFEDRNTGNRLQYQDHLASMYPEMFTDNALTSVAAIMEQALPVREEKDIFVIRMDSDSQLTTASVEDGMPKDTKNIAAIKWSEFGLRANQRARYVNVFTAMETPDGHRVYLGTTIEPVTNHTFNIVLVRRYDASGIVSPELINTLRTLQPMKPDRGHFAEN